MSDNSGCVRRKSCALCRGESLETLFSLPPVYIADKYATEANVKGDKFHTSLVICQSCNHVQLDTIINPSTLFDAEFSYKPSKNEALLQHFSTYADLFMGHLGATSAVLDIGSNDGTFLECLRSKFGCSVLGLDPVPALADFAKTKGIDTVVDFLSDESVDYILDSHGQFDLVSANNVFAHSENIDCFIKLVASTLRDGGQFSFEISYLPDIVDKKLIGTIFHEHSSYHHLAPLIRALETHGLFLWDGYSVDTQGGAFIGVAVKGDPTITQTSRLRDILEREADYKADTLKLKFDKITHDISVYREQIHQILEGKSEVVGFGAARSANILIEVFDLAQDLSYIVDSNPAKIGKFLFESNAKVLADFTNEEPEVIINFAWVHAEKITSQLNDKFPSARIVNFYPSFMVL